MQKFEIEICKVHNNNNREEESNFSTKDVQFWMTCKNVKLLKEKKKD